MNKMFEGFDSLGGVFSWAYSSILSVSQCTVLRITVFGTITHCVYILHTEASTRQTTNNMKILAYHTVLHCNSRTYKDV